MTTREELIEVGAGLHDETGCSCDQWTARGRPRAMPSQDGGPRQLGEGRGDAVRPPNVGAGA